MFGKIENPKNEHLLDLNHREFATFAPLLVLAVWMGLYPSPFLRRLESSVNHIINRVNTDYASACGGGTPAAAAVADSSNVARFLTAAPCGPDGKPLAAPAADAPGVPR
jgi:NADH-quinone oxidoreductase subunit M